jgi:halimadienyl-diphosphate synthase
LSYRRLAQKEYCVRLPTTDQTRVQTVRAIASTVYDTAWVATLVDPRNPAQPRYPEALKWVLAQQHADGSWGSPVNYLHDRIICTLAALMALTRHPHVSGAQQAIARGQSYLWNHAHVLHDGDEQPVAFELLLPTMIVLVARAGIPLPDYLNRFAAEREHKLRLIPADRYYDPRTTLAHSLEFLGDAVDPTRLAAAQGSNGALGNSPAATAFLLQHGENEDAIAYLENCLAADGGAAVSVLEPCSMFITLWSAYHDALFTDPRQPILHATDSAILAHLLQTGQAISLDATFPIPDADNTAVAIWLLRREGWTVDDVTLEPFAREQLYVSFPYERHPSTGVNMHVMQALAALPSTPQRRARIRSQIEYLAHSRTYGTYWTDKWHISPLYATCHAVIALSELPAAFHSLRAPLLARAADWIRHTQRSDGLWGLCGMPTAEETAYAVIALAALPERREEDVVRIARAADVLRHVDTAHPALWIDKCLYYPPAIVESVLRAAQRAIHDVTWPQTSRAVGALSVG